MSRITFFYKWNISSNYFRRCEPIEKDFPKYILVFLKHNSSRVRLHQSLFLETPFIHIFTKYTIWYTIYNNQKLKAIIQAINNELLFILCTSNRCINIERLNYLPYYVWTTCKQWWVNSRLCIIIARIKTLCIVEI